MERIIDQKPKYSFVFDINGKNIKVGDKIRFWRFYRSRASSADLYGTEPQVSFTVYEEYMEFVIGEVVFELGAFCVKYKEDVITLRDVMLNTPIEYVMYYLEGHGGELNFEDEGFWGEELSQKLSALKTEEEQRVKEERDNDTDESYLEIMENYLKDRCKEF